MFDLLTIVAVLYSYAKLILIATSASIWQSFGLEQAYKNEIMVL